MSKALADNICALPASPVTFPEHTQPANSLLMMIQPTVQHFATLLANVLQLEVEVVDNRLQRVAGTGIYSNRLGKPPESNTLLLNEVIENKQEVVIFDSRQNHLCQACQQRETCRERGFVGVPVTLKNRVIGVVSLVAVNITQLTHLKSHTRMFIEYIRHISRLLVENISVANDKFKTESELVCFLAEHVTDAILLFDASAHVVFMNNAAYQALNITSEGNIETASIIHGDVHHQGFNEFTLCWQNICWKISGQWHQTRQGGLLMLSDSSVTEVPARESPTPVPEIKNLIGRAPEMNRLKQLISRVAASPSSVLILGESGTGKEVVAQAIHQLSNRHAKPFVAINCAAIPENLLESELFGYAKGAFTGASPGGKKGLIQLADEGTLFLDEIGDMPLTLQARLLRAIERREVLPVGASQPVKVDIRIISATHQHLLDKIRDGSFREDLYYRLNVVPLTLPPLNQRGGDIQLLLQHFITLHARRIGCAKPQVTPQAMKRLCLYSWPGNVRELSNLVEYLLNIVPPGECIDVPLLPPAIQLCWKEASETYETAQHVSPLQTQHPEVCQDVATVSESGDKANASLRLVERQMIAEALQRLGNKKLVADELGIGVATLYRKIKKYGLS